MFERLKAMIHPLPGPAVPVPLDAESRVLAMGAVFGLAPGQAQADASCFGALAATCAACPDRGACALLLSRGDLTGPRDGAFCPNATAFAGLAPRRAA